MVAGAAAVLLSIDPNLYNDDLYNILALTATYSGLRPTGYTSQESYGHGLIQVGDAVNLLLNNDLIGGQAEGGSVVVTRSLGSKSVFNIPLPGASDGIYDVTFYDCEKVVQFPVTFTSIPYVWGRGVITTGHRLSLATPLVIDQKRYVEVDSSSITQTGCTLTTHIIKLVGPWPQTTVRWYPNDLAHLDWGYAALGPRAVSGVDEFPVPNGEPGVRVYPNPFNSTTIVSFENREAGDVAVAIFNVRGQRIADLFDGMLASGYHEFKWDGRDAHGNVCASGAYFARVETRSGSYNRRVVLVK